MPWRLTVFANASSSSARYGASTYLADTWEWDGTEWTQMADTGPSARLGHAVTFDSKIKRACVIWREESERSIWRHLELGRGTEWTQEQDTGPAVRVRPRTGV